MTPKASVWRIAAAGLAVAIGVAAAGFAQDSGPPPPAPSASPASGAAAPAAVPPSDVPPEEAAPTAPPRAEASDEGDTAEADDSKEAVAPAAPAKPAEPLKRPRYLSAILQVVDKVTAKTLRFEAKVNQPVRYGALVMTVHACETTAADEENADSIAHLEVNSEPAPVAGRAALPHQVYRGWMFAGSPGLHPFASAGYDVWLIACKTASPAEPLPGAAVVGTR